MAWLGMLTVFFTIISAVLIYPGQNLHDVSHQLWKHRNLGKAFYENQTTYLEAVEQFRSALELAPDSSSERLNYGLALVKAGQIDQGITELERVQSEAPTIPHTWFNLGLLYKKLAQYDRARDQFEHMTQLVPDEPIAHYNLGILFRLSGNHEKSLNHFETATQLDPTLAGPHFQLYTAYRMRGEMEKATKELRTFETIKTLTANAAVPEDLEWSIYAEIYDTLETAVRVEDGPALDFTDSILEGRLKGEYPQLTVLDANNDRRPDLLAWTTSKVHLYKSGITPVASSGLEDAKGVTSIAAGDFNNDGFTDLCVLTKSSPVLYTNIQGTFHKHPSPLPHGIYAKALWMDFDHDNDLDLFLLGRESLLLRNNGDEGFSDHTNQFPFLPGEVLDATIYDLVKDKEVFDLVVTYQDRSIVLYRDRLGGRYEAQSLPNTNAGADSIEAHDIDNNGWTDLAIVQDSRVSVLFNQEGNLSETHVGTVSSKSLVLADLSNRGVLDLVVGITAFRNRGQGQFNPAKKLAPLETALSVVSADFNRDGQMDLAMVNTKGDIHLLHNQTKGLNHWLEVSLTGIRNLDTALAAKVEVRTGSSYQKRTYKGVPLHFGLGSFESVDFIRIIWPNGLIQNEIQQPTRQSLSYEEKERLSGSCPTLFAWNGHKFELITDLLGAASLGLQVAEDRYFPTDHDEYVLIDEMSLAPVNNRYEIRITEELREVAYLDQIRLLALDHPDQMDIFTNDKLQSPPFPSLHLFGVEKRLHPIQARDHRGRNVLPLINALDDRYPGDFTRQYSGVTETHALEMDFGSQAIEHTQTILVLNGWLDWAHSSSFLKMAQEKESVVMPYLQVKDVHGQWQTIISDMGIPAGKPKTIVVDLSNKFLSSAREVRIVTNLCIYWDEIFMASDAVSPLDQLKEIPLVEAQLRFRGFSAANIHPQRKRPEWFDYSRVHPVSMWNPTSGYYTRYGPVHELIGTVDDRFVIMGSGDEIKLSFDATGLLPPEKGFTRTFLFYTNGWVKDGDLNTAFAQTVKPLPFHGMSAYPYPIHEAYPQDAKHQRYQYEYNTRPALQLLRSLSVSSRRKPYHP